MKLLIVEDDDKLRTELARFFSGHGYETEEITDYENLEEAVWKAGGDLLLLDIGLPLTDGMFLCRSLRKKVITSYCDHYQPEYGNERTAVYELRSR